MHAEKVLLGFKMGKVSLGFKMAVSFPYLQLMSTQTALRVALGA